MNDKPKISIIMAVYNSEKYLREAVDSVLRQTYRDFELLLVDDGSTDSCGAICDEYASQDKRVVVIHKENGGACSARNLGMSRCKADLVTFIDNDDYYDERFLEIMIGKMEETDADYIKCGRRNIKLKEDGDIVYEGVCSYASGRVLSLEEFIEKYVILREKLYLSSVWNGVYKKDIIKKYGLSFREDLRHGQEDVIFNCEYEKVSKTFVFVPDVLYTHFIRIGHSVSSKFYADIIYDVLDTMDLELKIVGTNKSVCDLVQLKCLRQCYALLYLIAKAEREPYKKAIREHIDFNTLKTYPILTSKEFSIKGKFFLLALRYGMTGLLFFSKYIREQCVEVQYNIKTNMLKKPNGGGNSLTITMLPILSEERRVVA